MGPKRKENEFEIKPLRYSIFSWGRWDLVVITFGVICLLVCGYVMYTANNYQEACNTHYMAELERIGCISAERPEPFTENLSFMPEVLQDEDKNKD